MSYNFIARDGYRIKIQMVYIPSDFISPDTNIKFIYLTIMVSYYICNIINIT